MDLSSFIKENCAPMINEGIRNRDLEKAIGLISKYLLKRRIYTVKRIYEANVDGSPKLIVFCWNDKNIGAGFIWSLAQTSQIEAIAFTDNFDSMFSSFYNPEDAVRNWDVYVEAKGANTIQMCKMVEAVMTGQAPLSTNGLHELIRDAQLFEGVVGVEPINEADDAYILGLRRQRDSLYRKLRNAKMKNDQAKIDSLQQEYDELQAKINGARTDVRANVTSTATPDTEAQKYQNFFEEEVRATPEERFDDMNFYIASVIKGRKPFAILCGAPGIGKTFRIMQMVKSCKSPIHGGPMEKDVDYYLLKGRCTPSRLYMTLHDYKQPGQLCLFDDCDEVFKDQTAINILKAAYDSSDERWVSWETSALIPMPIEDGQAPDCDDAVFDAAKGKWYYPRQFLYEGGGILITNFSAGQIDTAVRNRAYICDLNFTVEEVLQIIESIAPKLNNGMYDSTVIDQSLEYLRKLDKSGAPVELSIRSFMAVADMYLDTDAPKAAIERRIREQMKNQFLRGGRKY